MDNEYSLWKYISYIHVMGLWNFMVVTGIFNILIDLILFQFN